MKFVLSSFMLMVSLLAQAESNCDVRVGDSIGHKVVEFATGHVVHSKMSLTESTAEAMLEEMVSLQDMGLCSEKILAKKCVLKFEKKAGVNSLALFRGQDRWNSWGVNSKKDAQVFVKGLQRAGFCS